MEQQEHYLTRYLPEDVLAQVISRLAPRDLATSRCVCKEWRDTIDGRCLLRTDLLPLSVGGIFLNFAAHCYSEFFHPSRAYTVSGRLDYLPEHLKWCPVVDHCNGLLLLGKCVVNPATRWWAPLPPWPDPPKELECLDQEAYIVFDPAVSPHYSVFILSYVRRPFKIDPVTARSEWPPSPYFFHIFSSRTGQWEQRPFVREGEAVGTIGDIPDRVLMHYRRKRYAAYWKGALYVHCQYNFFIRISLSEDKYQVIKPPAGSSIATYWFLGKSEKGIYLATFLGDLCLKVWILNESCHENEWVLRYQKHLRMMLPCCYNEWVFEHQKQVRGPWILEDINFYEDHKEDMGVEAAVREKSECNSDEDYYIIRDGEDTEEGSYYIDCIYITGFHPYKEIVFLHSSIHIGLAYDLNSSKSQYLGDVYPPCYDYYIEPCIEETFVYTPCRWPMAIQD